MLTIDEIVADRAASADASLTLAFELRQKSGSAPGWTTAPRSACGYRAARCCATATGCGPATAA